MKKYIIALLITLSFFSCQKKNDENPSIENITQGPIVKESLSNEQLNQITYIQRTFSEVFPISLEETITNFKRDQNPDSEIGIWLHMANAYENFSLKNSEENKLDLRKEAFKLVFLRSMMTEEEIMKNEKDQFKLLNEINIKQILKDYNLNPKPINIKK
ncbi:hypothetical protein [Winogradskyella forsetii]|uniref:hypothetical protein n=1 Tax=Winogradskyella forsetii TaxID=2686077 RepID=UPI0015BAF1B6|nr:hypothetical protein [Winogradskyella forsetii]